jgi:hypothetical protein
LWIDTIMFDMMKVGTPQKKKEEEEEKMMIPSA